MKHDFGGRGIHLSTLTILSIGVAVAAAVAICISVLVTVYSSALRKDAAIYSEQSVQQTMVAVNNYVDGMKNKLSKISDEISESQSAGEINERVASTIRIQSDIYAVMVYDMQGNLLYCSSDDLTMKKNIYKNLSFDKELFESAEEYAVTLPHVQTIFEGRYPWVVTMALREEQPLLGGEVYVAIDFRFSEIAKYIDNVGVGRHGYCYIIDSDGNIVYHPQQQMIFSGLKTEDTDNISALGDGVHVQKNVIYAVNTIPNMNWRIVGVSYIDELMERQIRQIIIGVIFSFVFCAIIAIVMLAVFSKIVTKPVRELVYAMKAFEKSADTFRYNPQYESVAEIRILSDSFAHMAKMTQQLMERVRSEEVALRKTELKALQAQINPHFLYNTLDSIQWMCEQGHNEDAIKMVGALAKLFRISISRGHELITIRDELQHARSYLIIQSFRYRNQFSYEFIVDEELEDFLCNKITIQPLIENAIYHGIDRMVDEGKITVRVRSADDGDILIEVEDNGVGMTPEQCSKILEKERGNSSGIGVKNVNDRLKIYFGEKYGLSVQSELDVGTKVTVRIPRLRKEPKNEI